MNNIYKSIFFAFALALSAGARADFLTAATVKTAISQDGNVVYEYIVSDLQNSDRPIVAFSIDVPANSSLQSITAPDGWNIIYDLGDPGITWSTSDPFAFNPINPGSNAVFSFESPLSPDSLGFEVDGLDATGSFPAANSGQILGPSITSVPEPTSAIPLGTGLIALAGAGYVAHRQSRRDPAE